MLTKYVPKSTGLSNGISAEFPFNLFETLDLQLPRVHFPSRTYDMSETETDVTLTFNVAGLDKKNISVRVEGNVLVIEGKTDEKNENVATVTGFTKKFDISDWDMENISAKVDNGLLNVTIGKLKETVKEIEIK